MVCATARCQIRSSAVPCLHKDFVRGSISREEKWLLSRGRTWDSSLTEGACCGGGSFRVEGCSLSTCLFDCRVIDGV